MIVSAATVITTLLATASTILAYPPPPTKFIANITQSGFDVKIETSQISGITKEYAPFHVAHTVQDFYGDHRISCNTIYNSTVECKIIKDYVFPVFVSMEISCPLATPQDCQVDSAKRTNGQVVKFVSATYLLDHSSKAYVPYSRAGAISSGPALVKAAQEMSTVYDSKCLPNETQGSISCSPVPPNLLRPRVTCMYEVGGLVIVPICNVFWSGQKMHLFL